jgi:NAD(P)-dependent dehydrogenase (short-subunit alcohol dehydrogenase family)
MTDPDDRTASFAGKTVAITGAGRGLGRALALLFAAAGARTILIGRGEARLRETATAIAKRGHPASAWFLADSAVPDEIERACAAIVAREPAIDILVNNAATWLPGNLDALGAPEIAAAVAANVTGTVLATKFLLPALRRSAGADIVTLISTSGTPAAPFVSRHSAFDATRHAQHGFVESLRQELKPDGIRVIAIYPPDFVGAQPDEASWQASEGRRDSGLCLTARDVAETILFALSRPRIATLASIVLDNNRAN